MGNISTIHFNDLWLTSHEWGVSSPPKLHRDYTWPQPLFPTLVNICITTSIPLGMTSTLLGAIVATYFHQLGNPPLTLVSLLCLTLFWLVDMQALHCQEKNISRKTKSSQCFSLRYTLNAFTWKLYLASTCLYART